MGYSLWHLRGGGRAVPDVAGLIIGNEILTGRFPDENGPHLARRMWERGWTLRRLVVLPDDEEAVADEVRRLAGSVRWLVTSGGIGPTHDDVTFAAVARGLGVGLEARAELEALVARRAGPVDGTARRMVRVPAGAVFWWEGEIAWPVVVCGNVLCLPGVPDLFRRKLDAVLHRFEETPRWTTTLRTAIREVELADRLQAVAAGFPRVALGSYPRREGEQRYVLLTLDGQDEAEVRACEAALRAFLPGVLP